MEEEKICGLGITGWFKKGDNQLKLLLENHLVRITK